MRSAQLLRWAAWSPGLEDEKQWRVWAASPQPLERDGVPALEFVPSMLRRRCDPLTRMLLHVIQEVAPADLLARIPTVFASRFGPLGTMIKLLERLAVDAPLSPAAFSHSVNNTPAGLFSIWATNRAASTCVAAGADTFAHGYLEALSMLSRQAPGPVILVVGDAAVPEAVLPLACGDTGSYALALLLGPLQGDDHPAAGESIDLDLAVSRDPTPEGVPDALSFLRWLLSGERRLRIERGSLAWEWSR